MVAALKSVRHALLVFLTAALVPFVMSFAFFLMSARNSVLTTPQEYIGTMKREGSLTYMIGLPKWKSYLARDTVCLDAEIVVIGSSRVREIDQSITGRPTCNLYMDGLEAFGFERLSRALPPVQHREHAATVFLSIDHFWFWLGGVDHFESVEQWMLEHTPELWRVYAVLTTLNFFQWRDVVEVTRRFMEPASQRFDDQNSVWYPDGHLYNPRYYASKRAGYSFTITEEFVNEAVFAEFEKGGIREENLRAFEEGVRRLHDKGYAVRAYWSPVTPQHIAAARRWYPAEFEGTISRIDALARELPFDRYLPAMETLDASRFGCSNDWGDTTHVDLDCLRLVFRTLLPPAGESTLAHVPGSRSSSQPGAGRMSGAGAALEPKLPTEPRRGGPR